MGSCDRFALQMLMSPWNIYRLLLDADNRSLSTRATWLVWFSHLIATGSLRPSSVRTETWLQVDFRWWVNLLSGPADQLIFQVASIMTRRWKRALNRCQAIVICPSGFCCISLLLREMKRRCRAVGQSIGPLPSFLRARFIASISRVQSIHLDWRKMTCHFNEFANKIMSS